MSNLLVTNSSDFERLTSQIGALFQVAHRLPQLVFRPGFGHFRVVDFDDLFTARMWEAMATVSSLTGASLVTFAVTDPAPEAYFHVHFGHFGAARFPIEINAETFLDTLAYEPPSSPADALIYNANVVLFYPNSGAWLCWGERELGVAVFAFSEGNERVTLHPCEMNIRCTTPSQALELLIARNFAAHRIPRSFTETFLGLYGDGSE